MELCCTIECNKQDQRYCASRRNLLTSGVIELNPGPVVQGNNIVQTVSIPPMVLLQSRLSEQQLRILDVGGAGDCFFKAVSHQIYGEHYHMDVRTVGVQYIANNPERFIESNTDHSWATYLTNMYCQGTWCDALIVQAVADAMNLTIRITESNEGFAAINVIHPIHAGNDPTIINIGHVDEVHYVSTTALYHNNSSTNTD